MKNHFEELEERIKALDAEERKVVLASIPTGEILEHLQTSYARLHDKIGRLEAIVKED